MQIDIKRLEALLRPKGYSISWTSETARQVVYAKEGWHPELYELINIQCGGKRGESVSATVRVTTSRGRAGWGDKSDRILVMELASDKQRGTSIINTSEEAVQWERQCAAVAPARAAELARRIGPAILNGTAEARAAANEYLRRLLRASDPIDPASALCDRATEGQVEEAVRIARSPVVVHIPDGLPLYTTAALAIVLFGDEVEKRPRPFWGAVPLENNDLMMRLQLIVDRMPHPPNRSWQLPTEENV